MKIKLLIPISSLVLTLFLGCQSFKTSRMPAQIPGVTDHLSCFNHFQALMSYTPKYNHLAPYSPRDLSLEGVQSLKDFEQVYGGWSYFQIQQELPVNTIRKFNRRLLETLEAEDLSEVGASGRVSRLTDPEAKAFYRKFKQNPIAKCYLNYERPSQGTTGFCFGRSAIAHIEALRRGVEPESIKKIWVIGEMGHWGHHVAPMIKTESGWKVFDDIFGFVSPREWIEEMELHTEGKQLMYFVSSAERFGPSSNSSYSTVDLFGDGVNDYYNGFFKDYFNWVREQPEATPYSELR